jgi:hypothetical protein
MPTINNPFTIGTTVAISNPFYRYPLANPPYMYSTPPGVPGSYPFTWTAPEISSLSNFIAYVNTFYTTSGGLIITSPSNNFGMSANEITAYNAVATYVASLSPGLTSIPQATLQAIIIVSQMVRNWAFANINLTLTSGLATAAGIMNANPTITAGGTGYVVGTYPNTYLTGGSGSNAQATIAITGGALSAPVITALGTGYTAGVFTGVSVTGGSGTGANLTVVVSPGIVSTVAITAAGSGYTAGTYTNVSLTGGSGSGAKATIIVVFLAGGAVTSAVITAGGTGYLSTDTLSATAASLGGTGSGLVLTPTVVVAPSALTVTAAGSGYLTTDSLSFAAASVGGVGTGVIFTGTATATAVTTVTLTSSGFGYKTGDTLSVLNTSVNSPNGTGFVCTPAAFSTGTIVTPSSGFPVGATTVVSNDGYFLCEQAGTGNWFVSNNQDGTFWNVLTTASIETRSDQIVAVDMFAGGGVVLFGTRSLEFWYDAGTTPFPYQRVTGEQQDWGLAAKWSRAYIQNSIAFLGQNFQGQVQIMMFNGYTPTRISTGDIENIINSFTVVNDALAYSFVVDGHPIYRITFPTGNRTFDYDNATGLWNETMSGIVYPYRHLSSLGITYNFCDYASDCVSGSMYYLDTLNYTDNGSYIYREVDTVHLYDDGNQFSIDELFLDMALSQTSQLASSGDTAPSMTMYKSTDNGNTFGSGRAVPIGTPASGVYSAPRVIWRRLGSGRDFVLKFVTQSAVPFIIAMGSIVIRKGTEK